MIDRRRNSRQDLLQRLLPAARLLFSSTCLLFPATRLLLSLTGFRFSFAFLFLLLASETFGFGPGRSSAPAEIRIFCGRDLLIDSLEDDRGFFRLTSRQRSLRAQDERGDFLPVPLPLLFLPSSLLLLQLPERLGFRSPSRFFLVTPAFGFLANPFFLLGNRDTNVTQCLFHQRMARAVALEQGDRGVTVTACQQALGRLYPFRRHAISRFLAPLVLCLGDEIRHLAPERGDARIVEPNRRSLIELLESAVQTVLLDVPCDRLQGDLESLLLLFELALGLEGLRDFCLECARARGPLFARYRVDRGLRFLEVTSIERLLCPRENGGVRCEALGIADGSEGRRGSDTHRVRRG
jgi:hypothetical protein